MPVHFAEADKRVHLVNVPADDPGEVVDVADERVGLIVERVAIDLEAQQQGVKQPEAFGIRVANHVPGEVHEGPRDREARAARMTRVGCEQVGRVALDLPDDGFGGYACVG